MIARRAVFGLFAGLPFVGKAIGASPCAGDTTIPRMQSSIYEEQDFPVVPWPARAAILSFKNRPITKPITRLEFAVGVKTLAQTRDGLRAGPQRVVVFEIKAGSEIASFGMPARHAREYAERLNEFADFIEAAERKPT